MNPCRRSYFRADESTIPQVLAQSNFEMPKSLAHEAMIQDSLPRPIFNPNQINPNHILVMSLSTTEYVSVPVTTLSATQALASNSLQTNAKTTLMPTKKGKFLQAAQARGILGMEMRDIRTKRQDTFSNQPEFSNS